MKKIIIALVIIGMLTPAVALAETTKRVKITGVRVQHNRTWIFFTPSHDMGCEAQHSVEIANTNPNQKLIISSAMSAMLAGKEVFWFYTPENCSNVNKNVVNGIMVYR